MAGQLSEMQFDCDSTLAVDVYDIEPLPLDHPLRKLDNVMLSPHLGYVS